jgi:hypothetical protein
MNELGSFWLEYTRIGLDRAMESRKKIPESQIYDVRLRDIMANPMTVLGDIYSHFDLEFNEEIKRASARNRPPKKASTSTASRISASPTSRCARH